MSNDPAAVILVTLFLLSPVLSLVLLRRHFQPAPLSPVWIVVSIISIVGVLGFLLSNWLVGADGGSIIIELTEEQRVDTAMLYGWTAWLILLGATAVLVLRGRSAPRAELKQLELNTGTKWVALLLAAVPVLVVLGTLGSTFLQRNVYLAGERGDALLGLGQQGMTASAAIAGYVFIAGNRAQRFWAGAIGLACLACFFSLGSRRLALLAIVFAIGAVLARPDKWKRYIFPAAIVAFLLLPIPLFLRGTAEHGLIPYLSALGAFDAGAVDWRSTLNNVLISFPITGATVYQTGGMIPMEYFWISLNPLPGSVAGFYDLPVNLGLNRFTPFSTIGEVWNRGPEVAIFFWLVIGVVLIWLEGQVGRWVNSKYSFVGLGLVVLSALFALTCLQYNLRASGRMLVYAIAIAVAAAVFLSPLLRRSRPRNESRSDRVAGPQPAGVRG